jgi:hypothetical protein
MLDVERSKFTFSLDHASDDTYSNGLSEEIIAKAFPNERRNRDRN